MTPPEAALARFAEPTDAGGRPIPPVPIVFDVLDRYDFRVAAAWERIPKDWEPPEADRPDDDAGLWGWLWEGVRYDVAQLAIAAGLDEGSAADRLMALAAIRLVKPDGTISGWFVALSEVQKRVSVTPPPAAA